MLRGFFQLAFYHFSVWMFFGKQAFLKEQKKWLPLAAILDCMR